MDEFKKKLKQIILTRASHMIKSIKYSHFIMGPAFKNNDYNTLYDELKITNLARVYESKWN